MGGVLAHRLLLPGLGEGIGSGRVEGWEWRGPLVTPLVDQKLSEWLMKIIFLGSLKLRLSFIKSRLGIMGFSITGTILILWFFFSRL